VDIFDIVKLPKILMGARVEAENTRLRSLLGSFWCQIMGRVRESFH